MKPFLSKELELRTGNVLFMDIVGYSKLKADQQVKTINTLKEIVRVGLPMEKLLKLPTGDGMALAFLENPESPLLVARQIAPKVKEAGIPLRIGMHTGPVYLVEDIREQENIVGGGINFAQRVMDCGDAGHILASEEVAKALSEVKEEYERLFHYLGKFEVKHEVVIEIYNVYGEGFGNPDPPKKTPKHREIHAFPSLHNQTPPEPNFVGRSEMLRNITEWYRNPKVRIGALIGWGGVGKSELVRKWYDTLSENNIQPDGIFWWGFYRNPYLDAFLNELLSYVSQKEIDPETIKSTYEKVERIKEYLHKRAYLLILDGLEQMQKPESGDGFGKMSHRELTELLHYLADTHRLGLCLITTRFPLKDLENWHNQGFKSLELIDLSIPDALAMLKKRGVKGDDEAIKEVIERYKGHALSLTTFAGFLTRYHKGDITKAPEIRFVLIDKERFKDVNKLLHGYSEKMSKAELVFLKIFSLFRKEITEREFSCVFQSKIDKFNEPITNMAELDFKDLIDGLVEWRLILYDETKNTYTTHPLIKGYFESMFEEQDKKLCHKRLYQYFGEIVPELPNTLDQMQPLFEQVYHGCSAGLYDEVFEGVYFEKIRRGDEYFITRKLGAWETNLSLVRASFPKSDLSKLPLVNRKDGQSWLLNEVGLTLLVTGRPQEAEEPFLRSLSIDIEIRDWKNASIKYRNLAELQFQVGELEKGVESIKRSLEMAGKVRFDNYEIYISTARLAWILHLLGKDKEAEERFKKVDEIQRISGHRVCGLIGIEYADFLLFLGKIGEAFELTQTNLKFCQMNNLPADISRCNRLLGAIERLKGNHQASEVHLQNALEISRKVGVPYLEIEALFESGRLHLDMGRSEEAIQACQAVLKLCEGTGFKLYESEADVVLAKVYLAQGDIDKAKEFANSAYKKASEMHYHWPKVEAEELLKEISHRDI